MRCTYSKVLRPVGWFNVSLTELNIANFIIAEDFLFSHSKPIKWSSQVNKQTNKHENSFIVEIFRLKITCTHERMKNAIIKKNCWCCCWNVKYFQSSFYLKKKISSILRYHIARNIGKYCVCVCCGCLFQMDIIVKCEEKTW